MSAVAVHGRTKEQRPNHENNVDIIQKVVEHCNIPVIANGGSANTRDSPRNTYAGIHAFWKESKAASVMIARAAEWNPSVFRPEGKVDIYKIVDQYLDYAIKYDQPFIISKYNIQQFLGGDQVGFHFVIRSFFENELYPPLGNAVRSEIFVGIYHAGIMRRIWQGEVIYRETGSFYYLSTFTVNLASIKYRNIWANPDTTTTLENMSEEKKWWLLKRGS